MVVAGLVLEEIITLLEDRGAGTLAHEPLQELALRKLSEGEVRRARRHGAQLATRGTGLRLRHARRLRTLRGGQAPS